jgi:hypothetical protein
MKCKIINDQVVTRYVLHRFTLNDCDDPEIYMAQPIYEWQQTPAGKWCMEKATELEYHTQMDYQNMGYCVAITGYLSGKNATFWELKKT